MSVLYSCRVWRAWYLFFSAVEFLYLSACVSGAIVYSRREAASEKT